MLLSQDPYGIAGPFPSVMAGRYFVQHGYIYIVTSVRGTGSSGGQLDWDGARQGRDGAALVDCAAHTLPGSDWTAARTSASTSGSRYLSSIRSGAGWPRCWAWPALVRADTPRSPPTPKVALSRCCSLAWSSWSSCSSR
ncbi:CocE/NonD family hydrolase [Winogradskya consettensis]|uniref:CocE/NonD family hydrolase n=1 Tax=Winogradskya consettensis TaxID=113560 RepID=UPI001BB371CF